MSSPGSALPAGADSNPAGGGKARSRKQRRQDELLNTSIRASLKPSSPAGAALWTAVLLGFMWLIVAVNALDSHHLTARFAIKPRHTDGLVGIAVSPLLHANAAHLAANSIPFAALCWLMLWSGLRTFLIVTPAVWLAADAVDWITGPSNAHIVGVSGVVFGWMGYILARAFYGRSIRWIAIAVAVVLVFSSTFTGLLPHFQSNVYWAGHVVGFLIGVLLAAALHRRRRDKPGRAAKTAPAPKGPLGA